MPEKDTHEKFLIDLPDVFANIVNGFFKISGYGDIARKVLPEDLEDLKPRTFYKTSDQMRVQERDTVKLWKPEGVTICLLGIENQTDVDYNMPLRIFGYEGADYRNQLNDKKHEIYPVITVVLYYGTEKR